MATFHLELDKRVKLKNDKYNLTVRLGIRNDIMYLKIIPITEDQFNKVFIKKVGDPKSIKFRMTVISSYPNVKHFTLK